MRHLLTAFVTLVITYTVSAAPLPSGFTDDASPIIFYAGTWNTVSESLAVNGAYHQADSLTDTLSIEFYGTGATLFFVYDGNGATVDVCVNETNCVVVDSLGATGRGIVELVDLEPGLNEISVVKTVDDASVFNFDGVYIHPAAPVIPEQANTIDFEYGGETLTAQLPLEITSGDFIIAVLLTVLVTFQIIQFSYEVMRSEQ